MSTTTHTELTYEILQQHYAGEELLSSILQALENTGKKPEALTLEDFKRVDAFHLRGRAATVELASRVCWSEEMKVLDIGCGIGGSARYLAQTYSCAVTGIDMMEEYVKTAKALTTLSGLERKIEFQQGSALALPFAGDTFDIVWTEHVQMNIADKKKLYEEIFRILSPGGVLLFHDIFEKNGPPYAFPLPWANSAAMNFLIPPQKAQQLLSRTGLQVIHWEDTSEASRRWYLGMTAQKRKQVASLPGVQLLMGKDARQKIANLINSLHHNQICVCQAVVKKQN